MAKKGKRLQSPGKPPGKPGSSFTATQGQYLAYIYLYRKLHRDSPFETEIAKFFRVSPPSAHQMIVKLEEKGLIVRKPGVPRSLRVTVPRSAIPPLDDDEMDFSEAVTSSSPPSGLVTGRRSKVRWGKIAAAESRISSLPTPAHGRRTAR